MLNKSSNLLINHYFGNNAEKKISTDSLKKLSHAIAFLFPNESKETYYTLYKKLSNKLTPAHGKLWDKYCNMRKEIRNSTKQSDGIRNELDTIGKEQLAINNKGIHTSIIMA
ncbi:unnamed protein product [Macrosiphum euphorbiae]|uniref:Uncharacterized protein n=1 Tax=Macrosiphum euphorbiae TaxID=13131 RepID=A0AAV0Y474_9HEMI|nr:unnamed protein product [Macrosiphum euphorbiae]